MGSIYGQVAFEGKTYFLYADPDFTGRQLGGGFTNYNDASEGEVYDVEISAPAYDDTGSNFEVRWIFQFKKGSEPELEDLSWSEPDAVRPV